MRGIRHFQGCCQYGGAGACIGSKVIFSPSLKQYLFPIPQTVLYLFKGIFSPSLKQFCSSVDIVIRWQSFGQQSNLEALVSHTLASAAPGADTNALMHLDRSLKSAQGGSQGLIFTSARTLNTMVLVARLKTGTFPLVEAPKPGHKRAATTLGGNKQ